MKDIFIALFIITIITLIPMLIIYSYKLLSTMKIIITCILSIMVFMLGFISIVNKYDINWDLPQILFLMPIGFIIPFILLLTLSFKKSKELR